MAEEEGASTCILPDEDCRVRVKTSLLYAAICRHSWVFQITQFWGGPSVTFCFRDPTTTESSVQSEGCECGLSSAVTFVSLELQQWNITEFTLLVPPEHFQTRGIFSLFYLPASSLPT
uniref:Uncharacterized protein n=1 Tax=Sphaerodactylus townsendi TaxID=933632 RepID=A0ACB8F272_9SAUR